MDLASSIDGTKADLDVPVSWSRLRRARLSTDSLDSSLDSAAVGAGVAAAASTMASDAAGAYSADAVAGVATAGAASAAAAWLTRGIASAAGGCASELASGSDTCHEGTGDRGEEALVAASVGTATSAEASGTAGPSHGGKRARGASRQAAVATRKLRRAAAAAEAGELGVIPEAAAMGGAAGRDASPKAPAKKHMELVAVATEAACDGGVAAAEPRLRGRGRGARARGRAPGGGRRGATGTTKASEVASSAASAVEEAPLHQLIEPGSDDERWVRNHPLYIKIMQRGYPLPFGDLEILALKHYTPKQYGGDAEVSFM
mmetsp:Transcript_90427/g.292707  ORF Transcript_90427/g.292707 Transcript_90427/m.292707 type:complete len:318 (-) Transcript_90427:97-1050(-)